MKVYHYRCFASDHRLSMQIYADQLYAALGASQFELRSYQPKSRLESLAANRQVMRYLRYISYPRAIAGQVADIHHILDHGYAHLAGRLGTGKRCVTVHDLIPLLTWKGLLGSDPSSGEAQRSTRKPLLNIHSLSFLPAFDQVIASSQNTADDLVAHCHLDRGNISVIPPIIGNHFKPVCDQQVDEFAQQYALERDVMWIMISGQEFYKNHRASLQVLARLNAQTDMPVKLIKSGLPSAQFDSMVTDMGLEGQVSKIFLQDASQLPLLYNLVDCLLFPSLYEGFGMPVIEALACGTPVVTSNRGALPEVGGELAAIFEPFDIAGLSGAVHAVLNCADSRARIKALAPAWVKKYRPDAVARSYEMLYQNMMEARQIN